ncbi:MAG TPA: halocarboxylic acid dehydrogenase DehI family protein [Terriglobales bacterium]|nr:halocarboxylic acid dehydrogenase DehI family protein [Terriglobales bacterium]
MALTRVYEEHEVGPELRRIYSDIRSSFDLPFVPTVFKLSAGTPEYLKVMWDDLAPVARSKEFQVASKALEEFARSLAISNGWKFADQEKVLAGQKFSYNDIEQIRAIVATFTRALARMALFARLMQRGYAGGQRGRVSAGKQASALSRMVTLHVPNESEAGLRVWLIYSDIRRTLGTRTVLSMYRTLSPFPGYLASVWMDSKKVFNDAAFMRARDEVSKRTLGLLVGLPVRDHRALARGVSPQQWRDLEETVDGFVRLSSQFALVAAVWQRSFGRIAGHFIAA